MLQTENGVEEECNHHEDNDHFEEEVKKDSENFYGLTKEFENQFIEFEEGMFIETRQVLLTETIMLQMHRKLESSNINIL